MKMMDFLFVMLVCEKMIEMQNLLASSTNAPSTTISSIQKAYT
jgi:hypothetical protein